MISYYKLLFRGFLALLWVPKCSCAGGEFKPPKAYQLSIFNIMFSGFWCFCPICNNVALQKRPFYHQNACISCISIYLMPTLGRKSFKKLKGGEIF